MDYKETWVRLQMQAANGNLLKKHQHELAKICQNAYQIITLANDVNSDIPMRGYGWVITTQLLTKLVPPKSTSTIPPPSQFCITTYQNSPGQSPIYYPFPGGNRQN
ncbi:hypothetical protein DSO57_1022726 [Entomophthora muscae]|uniref:Uncharacterized protein n=1 Tax=Entomophthora muscae TaxID=34485 RepID=A0ACC2S547_9FUNG|nr:hypothetical protein DSO57_1022726 [Entomophthora muscae]